MLTTILALASMITQPQLEWLDATTFRIPMSDCIAIYATDPACGFGRFGRVYDCRREFLVIWNDGCGDGATVRVIPADWDRSGAVDSLDFFAFCDDYTRDVVDPLDVHRTADFNGDRRVTSDDFFDYLEAFFGP